MVTDNVGYISVIDVTIERNMSAYDFRFEEKKNSIWHRWIKRNDCGR